MRAIDSMRTLNKITQEVNSMEKSFIRKLIVYQSPVTEDLEYRVAYFTSPAEAAIWEGEICKKYVEMNILHQCYTSTIER